MLIFDVSCGYPGVHLKYKTKLFIERELGSEN